MVLWAPTLVTFFFDTDHISQVAFGAISTALPLAYIVYRRKSSPNILVLGRNPPPARPPPRRQHGAIALQFQGGAESADASITPEELSKRREGFASLVPEDVPVPTRDEVSHGGLSALKAFAIATMGVFTVFGVSTLALRSYLNINTVSSRLDKIPAPGGQTIDD
jgi:hypothetical protein